jgi:threonine/homoserine/homoserine lactone efflux protein
MDGPTDALMFIGWVGLISLSGALMPGPVFATALARGLQDRMAGVKIALGHAMIEIPLIAAIYLGFEAVFKDQLIFAAIGIVGGIFLLFMGISMIRTKLDIELNESPYGSFRAGILLTATNPYFYFWWATMGAALVGLASNFGVLMIPIFALTHLACDFGSYFFLSYSVNRSKGALSSSHYHLLFVVCGTIMVLFALYFLFNSFFALAS